MNNNFNNSQRQSLVGVVIMFTDTFQKSIRALWPVLIVWVFKIKEMQSVYVIIGSIVLITLVACIAYLKYRNFTFYLDNKNLEFVVNSGIINKTRLAIPLNKIQQVNINQSIIQKIINVYSLEVDTAGSSDKEIVIKAITHDIALALKTRLLDNELKNINHLNENSIVNNEAYTQHPFIKVSLISLFKTGITSNYVRSFGLLLVFVFSVYHQVHDYLQYSGSNNDPFSSYYNEKLILNFIYFIIVGILIITLLINLSRVIIKFYGFKVTKQNGSLLLSYGLINTKNTIIRPDKVQIVTVAGNYFQKKFDIADLKIKQASNTDYNKQEQKKTAIEIPGLNTNEKQEILQFILDKNPQRGEMLKPNIRKLLLSVFKFILIPVSIYSVFYYYFNEVKESKLFIPVYIILAGLLVYFSYKNSRLFVSHNFIIKQSGAWDINNDITEPHKIQAIVLQQYFWQKSANVGSVTLHTAGGVVFFGPAKFSKLKQITNYWLYQVETSAKNWM